MPSSTELRDGITVRGRWGRAEYLPYDEVSALAGDAATLRSGRSLRLRGETLRAVEAALQPPAPSGQPAVDGDAWTRYLDGPWSPVRAARALIALGEAAHASDIHLEPTPTGLGVRLRLLGELDPLTTLPSPVGARLLAALKHISGCLPYRSDVVQEGRIARDGVAADVRASFIPTALGERAALRLFGRLLSLPALGLPAEVDAELRRWLELRAGLLLVAGPSGGGKTTTVYAALGHLAGSRGGAHLSIESPVEHRLRLAGIPVDQIELDPERGLTAAAALDGALRQDVDVIALAEVRSPDEAELALRAAHTGRLVIAGIHASSGPEARQRMLDLGAAASVLDDTLKGVLHLRLVAVRCPDHAEEVCPRCHGTGRQRRPIASTWSPQ